MEGPASSPTPPKPAQDPAKLSRWKHLTETLLPTRAQQLHWPIKLDHCFKRITLDHATNDIWYNHLPRPAERHLSGPTLDRALAAAESLLTGDQTLLDQLNQASLQHRGKLRPHHTK